MTWQLVFNKWLYFGGIVCFIERRSAFVILELQLGLVELWFCSVPFLSHSRSEGWPHHGRTFSIYLYPLSFWIDSSTESPVHDLMLSIQAVRGLPRLRTPGIVPCIISFSKQFPFSSWCDHSMLASFLWQCLAVPSLLQLCWELTHLFSLLSMKHAESFSVLSSQRPQDVFLHSSWVSSFHNCTWLQATLALSLVLSSLKSVCCDFSIFSAVMPRLPIRKRCHKQINDVKIISMWKCKAQLVLPATSLSGPGGYTGRGPW